MKKLIFRLLALYRRVSLLLIRASGRTPTEYHAARIVSGRSWDEFCDSLKAAGAAMGMSGTTKDARSQAEGYRYLTRLLRGGLEAFLEFGDPAFPELRRTVHETVKIGADNPDNAYYNAAVSGEYSYRIWGTRGTVRRLSLHMQRGSYGSTGGLKPAGKIDAADLEIDAKGRFEIIASVTEPARGTAAKWLPMTQDTSLFMVRQTFGNREQEVEADVRIERIAGAATTDAPSGPEPLSPEQLDRALTQAAAFVAGTSTVFTRWAIGFKKHPNELPEFDEETSTNAGGDPSITYYHSYWRLPPGQALVIETVVSDCDMWNFQVNNFWMESLDYRYHRIHINQDTAELNPDGSVTIVVASDDPGLPNWLTTTGHRCGTMCFRWIRPHQTPPQPHARVASLMDLRRGEAL
jgi:hypothetical protein